MRFDGRLAGTLALLLAALSLCAGACPRGAQAQARPGDDAYHLRADRLSGSATSEEDVYTAIHVTVEHGPTTVTGDSAHVYRHREVVEVMGNVKIVDGKTRMWGNQATYDRKSRLAILHGNVRIEEGTARITGDEARFYRSENRSVIVGNPAMQDSARTLTASQIDYDRAKDVVLATGNVVAVDRAESTTVRAGRIRYDRAKNYAWATEKPVLTIEEAGGKSTVVRGTTLEFDNEKRAVVALGDVQVERSAPRASAGNSTSGRTTRSSWESPGRGMTRVKSAAIPWRSTSSSAGSPPSRFARTPRCGTKERWSAAGASGRKPSGTR